MTESPARRHPGISGVAVAVAAVRSGDWVVLTEGEDSEDGSLRGYLCMAAEHATPDDVNFMATHARGLVCVPLPAGRAAALALPLIGDAQQRTPGRMAFTVSVEASTGVTTGISSADRARTVRALADPTSTKADFSRPGHVFPVVAADRGVFARREAAEAAVDLCRLAGVQPAAVTCELLDEDGAVAGPDAVEAFARRHEVPIVSVDDLLDYRLVNERVVERVGDTLLPLASGEFRAIGFRAELDGGEHMVLLCPDPASNEAGPAIDAPVYVHRRCGGAVFGSLACGCRDRLDAALASIAAAGRGAVVYLDGPAKLDHEPEAPLSRWHERIVTQMLCELGIDVDALAGGQAPAGAPPPLWAPIAG